MSKTKQWHIVAYDIRDERRLRRLHYFLKRRGLPLQRSVFLLHKKPSDLNNIMQGIRARTKRNEDDVRLYPINSPASLWVAGIQAAAFNNLFTDSSPMQPTQDNWLKRLFKKAA